MGAMELLLLFGALAVGVLVVLNLTSTIQRGGASGDGDTASDAVDDASSGKGTGSSREP